MEVESDTIEAEELLLNESDWKYVDLIQKSFLKNVISKSALQVFILDVENHDQYVLGFFFFLILTVNTVFVLFLIG